MPDLDVQLRSYLDTTAPPVAFGEIVTERFRDASVRPASIDRPGTAPIPTLGRGWVFTSVAALTTLAMILVVVLIVGQGRSGDPGEEPSATVPPTVDPVMPDGVLWRLHADDLAFHVTIDAPGWEPYRDFALTKSTHGPQGAEAILYWGQFPEGASMTLCSDALWEFVPAGVPYTGPIGRMTQAIAALPGLDVMEPPSVSTVGGYPAYRVAVRIREDLGCDPGYLFGWQPTSGGAFWDAASAGDTVHIWIVDRGERQVVDGRSRRDLMFIASIAKPDAGAPVVRESQQIVESLQFEGYATEGEISAGSSDPIEAAQMNEGEYTFHAGDQSFPALTATMPRGNWETYGGFLLSKSTQGSQGAEAAIYWTQVPTGVGSLTACHFSTFPFSRGRSTDDVPGLDALGEAELTTVGGQPARHVSFTVREDRGCDPGYFFGWKPQTGGMLWYTTDVGATIDVWFVDLDNGELFIASITSQEADPSVVGEIDAIVESIRFDDGDDSG